MRSLILLGATGSIGRQTQDVLRAFSGEFVVEAMSAHAQIGALVAAAKEFHVKRLVVSTLAQALEVRAAIPAIDVSYGPDALVELAGSCQGALVVNALLGSAGVRPTLAALDADCDVALANKETLVAAGDLVMARAFERGRAIVAIDSEHSAIAQCLKGASHDEVLRLVLTASGGPFRDADAATLRDVTVEQALKHPTWRMGAKITIDSATLMNKGFEVIEAHHLFGLPYDRIDVVLHPQSVVHSLVEFVDGALLAQLGTPDMRTPITYALFDRQARRPHAFSRLPLTELQELSFRAPDTERFPALSLAYACGRQGGTAPAILNAANEVAVAAFLAGGLQFTGIYDVVNRVVQAADVCANPSLEEVLAADLAARDQAHKVIATGQ